MTKRTNRVLGWLAVALLAFAAPALAGHHEGPGKGAGKANGQGPSPEQRARMAEHHERIAACLRSNRPIGECQAEMRASHAAMRKACEEAGEECLMGHPGHHGGKGKGKADAAKGKGKGKAAGDASTEEAAPES